MALTRQQQKAMFARKNKPFNRFGQVIGNQHDLARKTILAEVNKMTDKERKAKLKELKTPLHLPEGTTLGLNDRGKLTLLLLKNKARGKSGF